ncbi:MAG: hypothetical protein IPK76_05445 [Lewinellaceae bacterium]|nr:hypothetical protein [Lewinellaceae bacterium]
MQQIIARAQAQTYALKGHQLFSSNGIKAILNNKEEWLRPVLQNRQSRLKNDNTDSISWTRT